MSAPTSDPIGCGPMPDAAQEAGGAVAELLAKLPDAETLAELAREAQHNGLRIETNVYLIAAELQRAAARPCPALDECKDALENIALLDEADGHQLNRGHAYEAVAIATKVLGKHPSEILQSSSRRSAQVNASGGPRVCVKPGHLEAIRACPCLKCGTEGRGIIEAAHVRMSSAAHNKRGGIGEKPDDRWTVPLCTECHREQHKIGELSFWNEIDVNPLNAAERLHAVSPNDEKMRAVVKDIILERRQ